MSAKTKPKVVVGLSGGVDSSVAAALLLEQGFDVVGVHLVLSHGVPGAGARGGQTERGLADVQAVCGHLGIRFIALDRADQFKCHVIEPLASEYRAGRTPNPCVLCNQRIKFATLLDTARELGAEYIATGHYARVEHPANKGRHLLKRASDKQQDQSYFLFSLSQEELRHAIFPLDAFRKDNVRALARDLKLPTAEKGESQEICFVPDNDYGGFLVRAGLVQRHRGEIVTRDGRVLGYHDGVEFFTVGQRRGLRIAADRPLYVLELDPARNRVIVGYAEELERSSLTVTHCNWVAFESPSEMFDATVKIRYQHPGANATVKCLSAHEASVCFHESQRAVTPGQACVFYQDDLLLGGGWIA
ncbi:MAG: tRNA 2-thiouridine(34) synthase MnmA [Verrucomicrobiia bacterium]